MSRKFRMAAAIACTAASLIANSAFAQFRKAEDAVDYRQSAFTLMSNHMSRLAAMAKGEPGSLPPKASLFSQSEADIPWIDSKLSRQPVGISFQPIKLTGALQRVPRKTYIRAPKYPQPRLDRALDQCKADPTWTTYLAENAHHDVMIDAPQWLADILLRHS